MSRDLTAIGARNIGIQLDFVKRQAHNYLEEINLLNAAFDQFISDTTAWELTDPRVQEKKQDLLKKVREGEI